MQYFRIGSQTLLTTTRPRINLFHTRTNLIQNYAKFNNFESTRLASNNGVINYIDIKAKCRLKKLTCKGNLRQVFIRVYRLEIQSVMLVFLTQVFALLPLSYSLVQPPPLPCVNTAYT
jgi:hypothetical protein